MLNAFPSLPAGLRRKQHADRNAARKANQNRPPYPAPCDAPFSRVRPSTENKMLSPMSRAFIATQGRVTATRTNETGRFGRGSTTRLRARYLPVVLTCCEMQP
jgi:hypothetical protein